MHAVSYVYRYYIFQILFKFALKITIIQLASSYEFINKMCTATKSQKIQILPKFSHHFHLNEYSSSANTATFTPHRSNIHPTASPTASTSSEKPSNFAPLPPSEPRNLVHTVPSARSA